MDHKQYEIRTLADMLEIPESSRERFFDDLRTFLLLREKHVALTEAATAVLKAQGLPIGDVANVFGPLSDDVVMRWTDDGVLGVGTINLSMPDGKILSFDVESHLVLKTNEDDAL